MATEQAYIAATRFGYGPRPGDLEKIGANPKPWLRSQIGDLSVPRQLRRLEASSKHLAEMFRQQDNVATFGKFLRGPAFDTLAHEVGRRTNAAIESDVPFRERLVHFWSNHFTVSAKRPREGRAPMPWLSMRWPPCPCGRSRFSRMDTPSSCTRVRCRPPRAATSLWTACQHR